MADLTMKRHFEGSLTHVACGRPAARVLSTAVAREVTCRRCYALATGNPAPAEKPTIHYGTVNGPACGARFGHYGISTLGDVAAVTCTRCQRTPAFVADVRGTTLAEGWRVVRRRPRPYGNFRDVFIGPEAEARRRYDAIAEDLRQGTVVLVTYAPTVEEEKVIERESGPTLRTEW